jgi:DNA polymerase-3 subunit delta'
VVELLDIVGQEEAVARIQQALSARRIPHAFLFAGPAGVGRRTTALALAGTLLCGSRIEQPNAGRLDSLDDAAPLRQACGACADCRMVAAGTHPDLHLVYKELAGYHEDPKVRDRVMQGLGIDVIRSFLIAPAGRAPSRGRGKVFLVMEAELMSRPAQDALLKTLEEPPEGVTIVLLCRTADHLSATTRSRCRLVRFHALPGHFVKERLVAEGVAADEAAFWAALTGGSLGMALQWARRGMHAVKHDLLARLAAVDAGPDLELGEHLAATMDKLAEQAVREAETAEGPTLSKRLASRQAAGILLQLIASAYRDALGLATGADLPCVHADQKDEIAALAGRFRPAQLADIIEQLSQYERLLWRNVNPKIVWDNAVITCASAAPLAMRD